MNRAQRRKSQKNNVSPKQVATGTKFFSTVTRQPKNFSSAVPSQPDFSGVPLATVCQSIQLLINELQSRGYPVYDFDNKKKYVQGIQIIQNKVYFLAAEEESDNEKM